jgi:hypothetical protein
LKLAGQLKKYVIESLPLSSRQKPQGSAGHRQHRSFAEAVSANRFFGHNELAETRKSGWR